MHIATVKAKRGGSWLTAYTDMAKMKLKLNLGRGPFMTETASAQKKGGKTTKTTMTTNYKDRGGSKGSK